MCRGWSGKSLPKMFELRDNNESERDVIRSLCRSEAEGVESLDFDCSEASRRGTNYLMWLKSK